MPVVKFTLSFTGDDSDQGVIDFYDVAQALLGFQRSLALTTHLILNNEIITQAPSLKGAEIYALPPAEGSWKATAIVLAGIGSAAMAPRDSVVGHLLYSAYDYVVSQTLGFHVDFDSTLGKQYEELNSRAAPQVPSLDETRFDSLMDKCDTAIRDMHRPIVKSQTAERASIIADFGRGESELSRKLTPLTYEYVRQISISDHTETMIGRVSGYNLNTYRGRVFIEDHNRPIPFELVEDARNEENIGAIVQSMVANSRRNSRELADISFLTKKVSSKNGYLRSLLISKARRGHSEGSVPGTNNLG